MLEKPTEYQEVSAQQNEKTVYAEDINQIITNVEKLKGGQANEAPVSNIKDLHFSINELKERIDGLGNEGSSSSKSILFNKIKKISEININISEQEMILAVYELFTYLPIQKINNNTLSFVTFPKDLASFFYLPKIQVNALYNGITAIPFFNKNLSSDRSYIIDSLFFSVFNISNDPFVNLCGTADIDISQKDFSNIYTSCYIKFMYQDGFDNVEVNNSLTVY